MRWHVRIFLVKRLYKWKTLWFKFHMPESPRYLGMLGPPCWELSCTCTSRGDAQPPALSKRVGGGADVVAGSCLHFALLSKVVSTVRWVSRLPLRTGMGVGGWLGVNPCSADLVFFSSLPNNFTSTWLVCDFSYASSTFMLLKLNSCSWSPEKQVTEKKKEEKTTHAYYSPPLQKKKKKKRQKN